MMFRREFLLPCTLVFNIPRKTLETLELHHADLLETTRLEKGNFSKSHSNDRFKRGLKNLKIVLKEKLRNPNMMKEYCFHAHDEVHSSWVGAIIENLYSPE